jgi:hypothetical protein
MAGVLNFFNKLHFGTRAIGRQFTFVPSSTAGQGYPAGGETINFTTPVNTAKAARPIPPGPPAAPLPANKQFTCVCPAGYDAVVTQAAATPTLKNFNLQIFTSGNTQLATADYPAELKGKEIVITLITPSKYS